MLIIRYKATALRIIPVEKRSDSRAIAVASNTPIPPVHQAQLNRQQVDITLPKADIMKIRQKVGMVFQHFHFRT